MTNVARRHSLQSDLIRKLMFNHSKGIIFAIVAALLFGASTPFAKALLPQVTPVMLAGLLYLGSGVGLAVYSLVRAWGKSLGKQEAALTRKDAPWLAGAIAAGGVVGPVLLMWGLANTPASSASLLLNLEGVLTALLAWFVFKENFDQRIALGMTLIAAGGVCVSWIGRPEAGVPWSTLAIVGACLAWAIDNNLTRKVSAGDPVKIAMLKGLVAGSVNAGLAFALWNGGFYFQKPRPSLPEKLAAQSNSAPVAAAEVSQPSPSVDLRASLDDALREKDPVKRPS